MAIGGLLKPVSEKGLANRGWRASVLAAAASVRAEVVLATRERDFVVVDAEAADVRGASPDADVARMVLSAAQEAVAYASEPSLPWRWLSGSHNEGAWTKLHLADELVVELMSPTRLASFVPRAAQTCRETLPPKHPQRLAVQRLEAAAARRQRPLGDADRGVLRDALRIAYTNNERRYQRARTLRNLTLAMTVVLLALTAGAVVTGFLSPRTLPMCLEADAPTEGKPPQVCPTRDAKDPGTGQVALVAVVGMAAASISAARALSGTTRRVGPYSLTAVQGALKVALGGLLAIVGVTLLRAGWVPGVDDVDTSAEILAWAFLFGYAQQVLTGLLDQRAADVLAAPAAEEDASPPPPPPPPPPPGPGDDDRDPPPAPDGGAAAEALAPPEAPEDVPLQSAVVPDPPEDPPEEPPATPVKRPPRKPAR